MKKSKMKLFLVGVGAFLMIMALFMYLLPFVSTVIVDISGFDIAFDASKIPANGDSYFTIISLLIIAGFTLGGIVDFIHNILIYLGKARTPNKPKKEITKSRIILAIVLMIIIAIIPLILNLLTLKTTGYDSNPLASLGSGAILSGIFSAIGIILQAIAIFISSTAVSNSSNMLDK